MGCSLWVRKWNFSLSLAPLSCNVCYANQCSLVCTPSTFSIFQNKTYTLDILIMQCSVGQNCKYLQFWLWYRFKTCCLFGFCCSQSCFLQRLFYPELSFLIFYFCEGGSSSSFLLNQWVGNRCCWLKTMSFDQWARDQDSWGQFYTSLYLNMSGQGTVPANFTGGIIHLLGLTLSILGTRLSCCIVWLSFPCRNVMLLVSLIFREACGWC